MHTYFKEKQDFSGHTANNPQKLHTVKFLHQPMVVMSSTHDYELAICVAKADFKVPCSNICYYGTKKCGANQLFATHCAGKWNTVWDQKWWLYYINYSIIPKSDGCSALVSLSSLKVMVALLWLHFHPNKWWLQDIDFTFIPILYHPQKWWLHDFGYCYISQEKTSFI